MVVCLGIALLDSGPFAVLMGITLWVFALPITLPIALFLMPFGALIRMVLGLAFETPRLVALIAGASVGLSASVFFAIATYDSWSVWPPVVAIGLVAGIVAGWTWWRVEKPFLNRQKLSSHF